MNRVMRSMTLIALVGLMAGCGSKDADGAKQDGDKAKAGAAKDSTAKDSKGEAKKAPATQAPEKPVELTEALDVGAAVKDADDTRYKGVKMTGPKGASVVDSGMGLTVKWGEVQFEFRYEFEDEGAVAKGKKEAQGDDLDKLVKLHIDTPTAVLWESKSALGGKNNFSFVAIQAVGEKNLVCKNKGYGQFTKAQAEALLKTCQSAKK